MNAKRFRETPYGAIYDARLGRYWIASDDADRTFAEAETIARDCRAGGYAWRLPTQAELSTLRGADLGGTGLAALHGKHAWTRTPGAAAGTAVGIDVGGEGDPIAVPRTSSANLRVIAIRAPGSKPPLVPVRRR
jgi:hypothetical protein